VAEAVKAGVVSAGGDAEIFQCVKDSYSRVLNIQLMATPGFPKHSLRKSS
jgi:hypothetical protein